MTTRTLGADGPAVSPIGFGCMTMTGGYGVAPDRHDMVQLLRRAVDQGVTLFDTAEVYGPHANEELLGEALADRPDDVLIATKFATAIDPVTRKPRGRLLRPEEVAEAAEGSLRRLGVDRLDVYYQHRINPDIPIEDYAGAVNELVAAGKVHRYGLSEASESTIRRAHAVLPLTAVQSEYSLWWRRPDEGVLEACRELGIGFVPFSPLGKGFLTGTITASTSFGEGDLRASIPRFGPDVIEHNLRLVDVVQAIAEEQGATPGQVALAWLLAREPFIVPIPGTTKAHRLDENLGALDVTLTDSQMERLTALSDNAAVVGARYPDFLEAQTDI
ncbi:aldo/keto reductase [Frigoribacterium sp. MCBA15_019]|uniref:aldo/keto reductase n=1 Tax=Frigoribacterium sp. MCBA15_019 TaxID=1898745 RepID=UPI0008DCAF39|nr:aldo/keto reductase [Frigoribacterium sp. MCBA15_019]OII26488.1 aldehyde oxidase [Frigoribacterium sp. MCBA15_019]